MLNACLVEIASYDQTWAPTFRLVGLVRVFLLVYFFLLEHERLDMPYQIVVVTRHAVEYGVILFCLDSGWQDAGAVPPGCQRLPV